MLRRASSSSLGRAKPRPPVELAWGVAVDEEGIKAFEGEGGGEIDRRSGLANSAFLIDDGKNLGSLLGSVGLGRAVRVCWWFVR